VSDNPVPRLSRRQLEVLQLAADGVTGPQIASQLGISQATVKSHLDSSYRKLEVPNRAAAVAKAIRLGLIE
jgi:two-component system, NarL family, nitrate/nitrite response regulator NarL